MTRSARAVLPEPLVELVPPADTTDTSTDLFRLCHMLGMPLLPWQTRWLTQLLAEHQGAWAASEACLLVPRQNGKSYALAARILAGLFLLDENLITYTAHRVDTALEVFNLVDQLARAHPATARKLRPTRRAAGKETITTVDGKRFKVVARSRSTGRGFTGDVLIMDEALELRDQQALNAMIPTLATRRNSQLIYASSAGDPGSVVLQGLRDRGRHGGDDYLFTEYAATPDTDLDDRISWRNANPGVPDLITLDAIAKERARMSVDGFRAERLGIWPHELSRAVIPGLVWSATAARATEQPEIGRLGLAFDVAPDRSWASITAAWRIGDQTHIRVSRHDRGDSWLVQELVELAATYRVPITYDQAGPARDVAEALILAGIQTDPVQGRDFAASCARLLSGLTAQAITHHPFGPLDQAASAASARTVGEGWAFARRSSSVDISPLTAAALAVWASDHERALTPEAVPQIW